jgi:hypothetical protein
MDLDYYQTLIAVAPDSPAQESEVPAERGGKPTIATIQYAMLADHAYQHTQPDVLFHTWFARQDFDRKPTAAQKKELREKFFAKSQACLRASPLPKRHGFGLHFDEKGRIALYPMESAEYQEFADDKKTDVLPALRSKRG